jgi:predicted Rossmann fold flavoprotein
MNFDVVIIGGGAAGIFCGIEAGKRGRSVLVIEHNAEVGRKIVISGGGRCNFTNINTSAENFVSANSHFAKSSLARFTPGNFVDLVEKHQIDFYEKKLGQLFCRGRSREIVEMLLNESRDAKVRIETSCAVTSVDKDSNRFFVDTTKGAFRCSSLVIASGGLSFPKIGATGFGYDVARQFGIAIEQPRPSLVPLIFDREKKLTKLAGISMEAEVGTGGPLFPENILFTHRGLSGPAILQASNYWHPGGELVIDLLPGRSLFELLKENSDSRTRLDNFLKRYLPARFVEMFAPGRLAFKQLNELSDREIDAAGAAIHEWRAAFGDTEGWHKAEVTLGGVATSELSSRTFETAKVPGLYFIGEVIDVTGWLGGYNFQWAWSSGHAAGQDV